MANGRLHRDIRFLVGMVENTVFLGGTPRVFEGRAGITKYSESRPSKTQGVPPKVESYLLVNGGYRFSDNCGPIR